MRFSARLLILVSALTAPVLVGTATPAASSGYRIHITCKTPQPERQLSPKDCLNYLPDGTQTFTARVTDSAGHPVAGVLVKFTDSDLRDAHFRLRHDRGRTDRTGRFSDELVDRHPRRGEIIRATVTIVSSGARDSGTLRFR